MIGRCTSRERQRKRDRQTDRDRERERERERERQRQRQKEWGEIERIILDIQEMQPEKEISYLGWLRYLYYFPKRYHDITDSS